MNGVIAACGSWPLALHLLRWDTSNAFMWGGAARCKQSAVKDDSKWGCASVVLCRSMEGRQLRRDVVSFNAAMKVLGVLPQNY